MSKETITHEVKLQPAVIVILGIMAVGILANAFPKASPIQDAMADWGYNSQFKPFYIVCEGCN